MVNRSCAVKSSVYFLILPLWPVNDYTVHKVDNLRVIFMSITCTVTTK